jgi:hypothetical protein
MGIGTCSKKNLESFMLPCLSCAAVLAFSLKTVITSPKYFSFENPLGKGRGGGASDEGSCKVSF